MAGLFFPRDSPRVSVSHTTVSSALKSSGSISGSSRLPPSGHSPASFCENSTSYAPGIIHAPDPARPQERSRNERGIFPGRFFRRTIPASLPRALTMAFIFPAHPCSPISPSTGLPDVPSCFSGPGLRSRGAGTAGFLFPALPSEGNCTAPESCFRPSRFFLAVYVPYGLGEHSADDPRVLGNGHPLYAAAEQFLAGTP